jgi:hypothetical protein
LPLAVRILLVCALDAAAAAAAAAVVVVDTCAWVGIVAATTASTANMTLFSMYGR